MKASKVLYPFVIVIALALLPPVGLAQTQSPDRAASATTSSQADDDDRDLWGLVGLFGLAGLLGLKGRNHARR